jgi:hypothetical protein
MSACHGCGGVVGRDCFNPIECQMIAREMEWQRDQQDMQTAAEAIAAVQAERDAALAEVARLKEAERNNWHRICDVVALLTERTQPGGPNTLVPVAALNRYARAVDLAHKIKAAAARIEDEGKKQ